MPGKDIKLLSIPVVEAGRGRMKIFNFYSLLSSILGNTDFMILLHDKYYVSSKWRSNNKLR